MIRSDVVTPALAGQHTCKDVHRLCLCDHQGLEIDDLPFLLGDHAPIAFKDGAQVGVVLLQLLCLLSIIC